MVNLTALTNVSVYLLSFFFSDKQSQLCTTDQRGAICTKIYQPVCALIKGRDSNSALSGYRLYQKTLGNGCSACSDEEVIGYVPGECQDADIQICSTENRDAMCPMIYEPVCTISEKKTKCRTGFEKRVEAHDSSNGCVGCSSSRAKFFVQGECNDVAAPRVCEKEDREAQVCTLEYAPVCAYYKGDGCEEELCKKTVSNECAGCRDEDVLFVVDGACDAQ